MKRLLIPALLMCFLYPSFLYAATSSYKTSEIDALLDEVNARVATSAGAADAGKMVKLGADGYIDGLLGDVDLTTLKAGITGIVKGAGNGGGYSAATDGTDYLSLSAFTSRIGAAYDTSAELTALFALKAPLASPTFTGTVVLPSNQALLGSPTIATSIDPDIADGATIGSATKEWSDLYLADGGVIYFGNDQDVTLTHNADTGLTLNLAFSASAVSTTGSVTSGASFIIGAADVAEAELEILDGATLSTTDINIIDGISDSGSLTAAELLYVDGVTSAIQTQIDAKVTGPASATDNAIPKFDLTTGKLVQNTGVLIDDSNNITVPGTITVGSSTINMSSSNGTITILGAGDGQDEDATFDFNTTANTVGIGTNTGVTTWDFGSIILNSYAKTYVSSGAISVLEKSAYVICTTTCSVTLPVAVAGSRYYIRNAPGSATVITLVNRASQYYELTDHSAWATVNQKLVSGGAVTDSISIVGYDSTHYATMDYTGTWTDTAP